MVGNEVAKKDIEDKDLTREIKNVLLLNMSTFPNNLRLKRNTYQYTNGNEYYEVFGWGQLEPVPKMLKKKLEGNNEKLDLILIMASDATQKEKEIEVEEVDDLSNSGTSWKLKKGSAVDFFKEQISKEDEHVQFKVFTSNANNLTESMQEVVGFIRKIKVCNANFKLYLDMHGGLRQTQLSVDAVINLLAMENIHIEDAYSIAGVQDKEKASPIINVTKDMRIFDFVSGMNEFINYGRSKGLETFFGEQNKIVNDIRNISNAIQICDIDKFIQSLDKMKENMKDCVQDKNDDKQKLLEIFIENMKADYGKLLESDRTELDLLKWCGKKGFYQQALTVIESRIPRFLEGRVYEFDVDLELNRKRLNLNREEILGKVKSRSWQEDSNFLFEKFAFYKVIEEKESENGEKEKVYMNLKRECANLFWKETKENWKGNLYYRYSFFIKKDNYQCNVRFRFLKKLTREEERKFNIFIQLHMALKNQRNLVNHAASGDLEREKPENIFQAIDAYIKMVEHFVS